MKGFIIYFSKDFNSFYSKNLSIFVNIHFNNENINDKINEFKSSFYNENKDYFKNFNDSKNMFLINIGFIKRVGIKNI